MSTSIITVNYDNTPVFFHSDAFINATEIAKKFSKTPKDYLRAKKTKEYIEAVRLNRLTEQNQLVTIIQGGESEEQGTWLHPYLAVDFARWLSADFAVWCDMQIENILHPAEPLKLSFTPKELEDLVTERIKRVQGELVNQPQHNQVTITLAPRQKGEGVRRYLVTVHGDEMVQMWTVPDDVKLHTMDEFIGIIEKGFILIDKKRLDDITLKQFAKFLS